MFIVLLSFGESLATKCLPLNKEPCMARPILIDLNLVNPKTAEGSIWPPAIWFFENVSSKERVKPYFLWLLILSWHIFPENFIEISQGVQKIWRMFLNIGYFCQFSSIFWIFWHFFVTKKLMTLAYNRWLQHFFTFNLL